MIRAGLGYDLHRFQDGRRLILGGVEIPYIRGLEGHSDADVVLHSISDALLGACGMGDIGEHFPDDDAKYKDIDSSVLLTEVVNRIRKEGWTINNLDVMLILQEPQIQPFKDKIRRSIAKIAGIRFEQVNIKATTSELVGSIGRKEAAASQAIALIEK